MGRPHRSSGVAGDCRIYPWVGHESSYSFLLTDWVRRPDMVSQCMIGLNRGTNPQDQDVWKAMGIKDPSTLPYFGRLRYCYEGFWAWQRAFQPQSG